MWYVMKEGISHLDEYLLNIGKQEVEQQNLRWGYPKVSFSAKLSVISCCKKGSLHPQR